MPTKPRSTLLNRQLALAEAEDLISLACPLLQEIVNYSTTVFRACAASASGEENEDFASLMLYLHMIEFSDGIELLLASSCAVPAIPLVRSCFEVLLKLEYILQESEHYVDRALSWLAHEYARVRIRSRAFLDDTSGVGKPIRKLLRADKHVGNIAWPTPRELQNDSEPMCRLLRRPQFKGLEAFPSIEELAKRTRCYGQYTVFYRRWSSVSHGQDVSRYVTTTSGGEQAVWSLRNARYFQQVAEFAAFFLLEGTRMMLERFCPTHLPDREMWLTQEVDERFRKLSQLEITVTEASA